MNLLKDPWIPVRDGAETKLLTYRKLLCEDRAAVLALPRDDMEMACLQLLISLTQVIFPPRNEAGLFKHIDAPLSEDEFEEGITPFLNWFDLAHKKWPFMQVRGVEAKDDTAIQKLFGLPEGDGSHTFFNDAHEIGTIGLPAAAIALFNQASCAPNYGGGFKGGLRGVPVTTLVRRETVSRSDDAPPAGRLRRLIWWNVLHFGKLRALYRSLDGLLFDEWQNDRRESDLPTWVKPIASGEKIDAGGIGVLRSLFWQPAHVELIVSPKSGFCGFLQRPAEPIVSAFRKAKFNYTLLGRVSHPHSASYFEIDKKTKETKEGYRSFNKTAPAWTQLSQFLFTRSQGNGSSRNEPAAVIAQFAGFSGKMRPLELALGGYVNKQASVIERRHELVQIGAGWENGEQAISELTDLAFQYQKTLRAKVFFFGKTAGGDTLSSGLADAATDLFYQQSERLIHEKLRHGISDWHAHKQKLAVDLSAICRGIFEQLTEPYRHKPKMMIALAKSRASLNNELRKLTENQKGIAEA